MSIRVSLRGMPRLIHVDTLRKVHNVDPLISIPLLNSFSAKGNIELFVNNTDSGESARNELSHLKSALFGCEL